ncbi:hypothetical protein D3H65_15740 [Paraflavitalea soli]|uniref:Uncharacterized protein n=2 Tax=Paraflavitalea soli TaxID=2315862 RepID=A0A3B7MQV0_9BACT|nr:hypothetical protein D3H65_15740 [Paraflavitalea soli]
MTSLSARLQAMYIVSFSAGGWILLIQAVFLRLVRRAWFSTPSLAMSFAVSVYVITAMLFYYIFIINSYDEKICNQYEKSGNNDPNKRNGQFVSFFVAMVPYVLLLSLRVFFPRNH